MNMKENSEVNSAFRALRTLNSDLGVWLCVETLLEETLLDEIGRGLS